MARSCTWHVPAQQHPVDEDDVVEDVAVVGHVGVRHQQVAVPDPSAAVFLHGAAIDGDPFAELVVVPDEDTGLVAAGVALVLRLTADDAVRPEAVVRADRRLADDRHMTVEPAAVTDAGFGTDETERTDFDVVAKFGIRIDIGQGGNRGGHGSDLCWTGSPGRTRRICCHAAVRASVETARNMDVCRCV